MLPTLHSQLWGNSPTGEGRGQSNSGWGLSKTPPILLAPRTDPDPAKAGTALPAPGRHQLSCQ